MEEKNKKPVDALLKAITEEDEVDLDKVLKARMIEQFKPTQESTKDILDRAMAMLALKSISKDDSDKLLPALLQMQQQMMTTVLQMQQQQTQLMLSLLSDKSRKEIEALMKMHKEKENENEKKWMMILQYLQGVEDRLKEAVQSGKTSGIDALINEIKKVERIKKELRELVAPSQLERVVTNEGKVNYMALIKELIDRIEPLAMRFLDIMERKQGRAVVRPPKPDIRKLVEVKKVEPKPEPKPAKPKVEVSQAIKVPEVEIQTSVPEPVERVERPIVEKVEKPIVEKVEPEPKPAEEPKEEQKVEVEEEKQEAEEQPIDIEEFDKIMETEDLAITTEEEAEVEGEVKEENESPEGANEDKQGRPKENDSEQ